MASKGRNLELRYRVLRVNGSGGQDSPLVTVSGAAVAVVSRRPHIERRAPDEKSDGLELKPRVPDGHHRPLLGARDVMRADAVPESGSISRCASDSRASSVRHIAL